MTAEKKFKARVRQRMLETGESYTVARRELEDEDRRGGERTTLGRIELDAIGVRIGPRRTEPLDCRGISTNLREVIGR